jgi:hypothetical protein
MAHPTLSAFERMMILNFPHGVAVFWSSETDTPMYGGTPLMPNFTWQELPLLSKLGVHITQYANPSPEDMEHIDSPPDTSDTRNLTLEIFTTDYNPASPTFGIPSHSVQGPIILRRQTNQESAITITKAIIEPIYLFLVDRLAAIKAALPDHTAAALQYAELNPKAFKRFFKTYRAEQAIRYKGHGFETSECPVELAAAACEGCGVDESCAADGTGSNLRKCAKCLEVRYCSRECQASDWKAHRPFCKSAIN